MAIEKKEKKSMTHKKTAAKKPAGKTPAVKAVKKTPVKAKAVKPKLAHKAVVKKPLITPAAHPPKPAIERVKPLTHLEKPTAQPVKPVAHVAKPAAPAVNSVAPAAPAVKPVASVAAPAVKPVIPAAPAVKPVVPAAPEAHVEPVAAPVVEAAPAKDLKPLEIKLPITLKDLSVKLQEKPSTLIKMLMDMRVMTSINQVLEEKHVHDICARFNCRVVSALNEEEQAMRTHEEVDAPELLKPRPPVVTFMGHVDHGKTSLLDAIRQTKVAESEHGGITQHIGAYRVALPHGEITFLDTPGHEAFTAMRARGARITDIVVLVVAADDGVMPQTQEALDHAKAAGVSIIVALNKVDKPQANVDMVKKQLAGLGFTPEDWGGKTIMVPVSAKTGEGIDTLLEMILLEAQMLELKANAGRHARGVVVESKLSKGKGPIATLLVQNGTLRLNDSIIVGSLSAKIRAMHDAYGRAVREAGPAFPVEILGLSGVPAAGEPFFVTVDERTAKELAHARQELDRAHQMRAIKRISLEDLHTQIQEGKLKELKLIVKADVQGSLEAIKDTLAKMNISEIKIDFIHEGVGSINSSDVILAMASNALIVGFNVTPDEPSKELIAKEGVDVKSYNIIYEVANDIKAAIEGMLEPKLKRNFMGRVEVRKVFRLSRSGMVAGCFVSKGKVMRTAPVTLMRNGEAVFEGHLSSLKRFKDDVKEVAEGFECGITLAGYDKMQEGDILEAYSIEKILRKL